MEKSGVISSVETKGCSCSHGIIHKALKAQYCSTYTRDFMGMSQGHDDFNKIDGKPSPLLNRQIQTPLSGMETTSYQQPKQKAELVAELSQCSSRDSHMVGCGIVPTVVQRHADTQQRGSDQTTYSWFYGKRTNKISPVIKSLLPQELQQLEGILSKGTNISGYFISTSSLEKGNQKELNELPAVEQTSYSPQRISSWPGPLCNENAH